MKISDLSAEAGDLMQLRTFHIQLCDSECRVCLPLGHEACLLKRRGLLHPLGPKSPD